MQAKNASEETPVRYIKGVGPKKGEIFGKLGIETVSDLFYYLPKRYEDRSRLLKIKDLKPGESSCVAGEVVRTNLVRARTGTVIFEAAIEDETGKVLAVWYNQPYLNKAFSKGQKVMLYGRVDLQSRKQITHPVYEVLEGDDIKDSPDMGRIVPVYSLTADITQKYLRRTVYSAIKTHLSHTYDPLPTYIRARKKLVDSAFAVENIHFPHSFDNLEKAYRRLVFEEFFTLQMIMALRRKGIKRRGIQHTAGEGLVDDFQKLFDFELTGEQKKCIAEIENDMSSGKPMYRLLQGDVGSGKTVVAMYATLLAVQNSHQAAIMAPTEVLARQHYVTFSKTLMPLGVNVRLLVSGIDPESRKEILGDISAGEADVVIGTHALFQEGIDYKDLGLVVVDEEHKFGVDQRKDLTTKGTSPDVLVMTATPIPRSLALTVYGDMDISFLREKPAGREPVTTYWTSGDRRDAVYEFIRSELTEGRQAFIVYPRIKRSEKSDLKSAEEMYDSLKSGVFKDFSVSLVHGRMKAEEKDSVMTSFRKGETDVLIATTVIEVGVDIPNVTVIVVEHAERYGLAQLHQLRGRIGRGEHTSYCILIGEPKTEEAYQRLSTMAETDDGFAIAEKDLDTRGPGEFFGTRQSGLPELKVGNIVRDFDIMKEAREEAFRLVREDPALEDERHAQLKKSIKDRYRGKVPV